MNVNERSYKLELKKNTLKLLYFVSIGIGPIVKDKIIKQKGIQSFNLKKKIHL